MKFRAVVTQKEGLRLDWMSSSLGLSKPHCYDLVCKELWHLTWDSEFCRCCDTQHIAVPSSFVDLPLFFSFYFSFLTSNTSKLVTCFLKHFLTTHENSL